MCKLANLTRDSAAERRYARGGGCYNSDRRANGYLDIWGQAKGFVLQASHAALCVASYTRIYI